MNRPLEETVPEVRTRGNENMGDIRVKIPTGEGKYGNAYKGFNQGESKDAYWLEAEYTDVFYKIPIAVECWIKKLEDNYGRCVLVSNGSKLDSCHWELYLEGYTNTFSAFLPGLHPQPVHTSAALEKNRWYYLAMVVDDECMKLFIDGAEAACVKIIRNEISSAPLVEHGLTVGGDGVISFCDALIDSLRISNHAREITCAPDGKFEADSYTTGLWDFEVFDESQGFADLSGASRNLRPGILKRISLNEIESKHYGTVGTPLESYFTEVKVSREPVGYCRRVEETSLDGEWEMAEEGCLQPDSRERLGREWTDSIPAKVPGSVHTALVENGLIPDPSFGQNAAVAKLKSHKQWWFKKKFRNTFSGKKVKLVFEGVSAECEVWLNGSKLGSHSGAFGGPEFEVGDLLENENSLLVKILPAPVGSCWTAWQSTVVFNCVYGWHYVNLPAIGIWRSVKLVEEESVQWETPFVAVSRLENALNGIVDLYTVLKSDVAGISGKLTCTIEPENFDGEAYGLEHAVASEEKVQQIHLRFKIPEPKLWWPLDIGPQNLYKVKVSFLKDNCEKSLYYETALGIRSIEMQPSGEGPKSSSYNWRFVINGRPIFVKGTNWCSMDALMDFSRERYDRFLSLAEDQHVQILRAWGGGLAETEDFYDLCDRKGIMVIQEWQTCWNSHFNQRYDLFEETVRLNTIRLRNHPSLVMWAGGNESSLPYGRIIDMMAQYSFKFDGTRAFHRGDGFGNDHCHVIWEYKDIEHYAALENVMLNEFGLCSSPNIESVRKYMPENELKIWPQPSGGSFYAHLPEFNERSEMLLLSEYIKDFIDVKSIEDFVTGTQIAQVTALRHKMERARSRWPFETGVMSYKLNDVYIGVSWSSVDWYGVQKMAHYFTQDAFMPLHACVLFKRLNGLQEGEVLPVFLFDDSDELKNTEWSAKVSLYNADLKKIRIVEFNGFDSIDGLKKLGEIVLAKAEAEAEPLLVVSEVHKGYGIAHRTFCWLNYKNKQGCLFQLPRTKVNWQIDGDSISISNSGDLPAVGVHFECQEVTDVFRAEDSYFWLEPGEKRKIGVSHPGMVKVKAWNSI